MTNTFPYRCITALAAMWDVWRKKARFKKPQIPGVGSVRRGK